MFLNRYPRLKSWVSHLRFGLWKMRVHWRNRKVPPAFGTDRTCWVNPADIRYVCRRPHATLVAAKYANRGRICGGDWDRRCPRFEDDDLFKSFCAHFCEGVAWDQTDLYRRALARINAGGTIHGCSSERAYRAKCEEVDRLFRTVRREGYRSQEQIARAENDPYKAEDEISVCVGRDGDLLFEDGRHRLAIAKILDVESVPVKITMVHEKWHRFRMEIMDYAEKRGGKIYQRIRHPDLAAVPARYGDERFNLLKQALPKTGGVLLDIGAHWGYFCGRFEELGFDCIAVESSVKNAYFMEKIRRAENKRFKIHCGSIFEYEPPGSIDVVLALSVFHHFLKDVGSFEKLKGLLGRLNMQVMFFEPHVPGEPTMVGSYLDFDNEQFVEFILANSCLSSARCLGRAEDGRSVYMLQR